jgi:hypothetical protein
MQDNQTDELMNYHDDNRVLRYLLHTIKGLSPVSGGVLGDALEREYEVAEEETRPHQDLEYEADI